MELSSPESIRALMSGYDDPVPVRPRRSTVARRGRGERCRCGHCRRCLDDSRWERIFAEKFADPSYYTPRTIHMASPLNSL